MAARNYVTMEQTINALISAGFTGWRIPMFTAIGWAESGGDTYALNLNIKPGERDHLSLDVGLWQINDFWWPKVTRAQATDLVESAACVFGMVRGNEGVIAAQKDGKGGYHLWNTFKKQAHIPHLTNAIRIARAMGVTL